MSGMRVYHSLPGWAQNLVCSLEGARLARDRYSRDFMKLLAACEARTFAGEEEICAERDRRLRDFLRQAVRFTPYYREYGAALEGVQTLPDLAQFPLLNKALVQSGDFASRGVARRQRRRSHTSGTTGSGLQFLVTQEAQWEQWAVWWRYRRWHGIDLDTWCGYFGGRSVAATEQRRPPFWRINFPGHQILFSGYHLSPANLGFYVDALRRYRPPWLHGYPSLLALLAAYICDSNLDLGYQVRWITTGAENLLPGQRRLLEKAFHVTPRQHYGMAEGVANFSECELGRLHVDEDFAAVEFLPTGNGNLCRVVGTNFSNPAFPLLRYDTGDLARIHPHEVCACGRPGRLVAQVDGREEDYVVLGNGARLGRMDHVFKDLFNIREAQIYQRRAGEITVRVVRGRNYEEADERKLRHELGMRVGDQAEVHIEYWDRLPRTAAGKLRLVISEVPGGKLQFAA
ncbi:MAG: phenylacetate--CoA ligase family protein [Chlamydiota bacterium]